LKLKFAMGLTDYRELTSQIMGYSQQIRFEGAYSRGDNDMDVSSLEAWESFLKQSSAEEVAAFYEGIHAGANSEDPPLCVEHVRTRRSRWTPFTARAKAKAKASAAKVKEKERQTAARATRAARAAASRAHVPLHLPRRARRTCACATGASRRATS
jgi:hypothetical protein